ncbi:NAD(P)/FAD-dependent oxidoreductase [soil metagenome]
MSTPEGARIVVVGAGPAGLWAGWQAAEAGHHVTIVERAPQVGGMAASLDVGGLRVDLGSHRLHPSTPPAVLAKLQGLLGEDLQVRSRNGRIHLAGRWLGFPLRTGDLLRNTPRRFALGAARDAATGPLRHARADTFAEVVRASLGPTVADEFYGPYIRKIWGVDPAELSGELARRRVSASSPVDIVRRLVRGSRPEGRTFLYPRRGFGQLSEVLADAAVAAGAEIRLDTEVRSLDPGDVTHPARLGFTRVDDDGTELPVSGGTGRDGVGQTIEADLVWSTAPLPDLARRATPAPPRVALEAADRLEHRGLVLVYLVLDQPPWTAFDAHYLPGPDQLAARVSEPRNYRDSSEDPAGTTVLCAEVPATVGDDVWQTSDADLAARLVEDLARLGLPAVRVSGVRTVRLPRVYPVYRPGFEWDLTALEWWLADHPRLASFGRQGLFVPDNTHHALAMADAAARAVRRDGTFDHRSWSASRNDFRTHVVED